MEARKVQKTNNRAANMVWAIRDVVKTIIVFAKLHPNMVLLEKAKAKKMINKRQYEPIRKGLIGSDTLHVSKLLEKYMVSHERFDASKSILLALEQSLLEKSIRVSSRPSYTIRWCWTRFDNVPTLTFKQKIRLSDATHFYLNAEMNKIVSFIKLNVFLGVEQDTEYLDRIEVNPLFRDYDDYSSSFKSNSDGVYYVPSVITLSDRVWDIRMDSYDSDEEDIEDYLNEDYETPLERTERIQAIKRFA